jgi:hypothetical protein
VSSAVYKHVICVFGGKNRQKKQAALNTLPAGTALDYPQALACGYLRVELFIANKQNRLPVMNKIAIFAYP